MITLYGFKERARLIRIISDIFVTQGPLTIQHTTKYQRTQLTLRKLARIAGKVQQQ